MMKWLVLVVLAGCTDEGHFVVEPGILRTPGAPVFVEAPATAAIGESIVVRCSTYGDGCVEFVRTDVEVDGAGADVFPMDRHFVAGSDGSANCPAILLQFDHEATLSFDSPGGKEIRFHGRNVNSIDDEDTVIPLSLVVQ